MRRLQRYAKLVKFKNSRKPAIKIVFPKDKKTVAKVRKIPGRRFVKRSKEDKFWAAPVSLKAIEILQSLDFHLDQALLDWEQQIRVPLSNMQKVELPKLNGELRPFQHIGVSFIEHKNGRALIADEMGLGKTIQTIGWMALRPDVRPVLVVCPASMKIKWVQEIETWIPGVKADAIFGIKVHSLAKLTSSIVVINYDILPHWTNKINSQLKPKLIVFDECHNLKNNDAKKTKTGKSIARKSDHIVGLSGTPITNKPKEFWNIIQLIEPGVLPSYWTYMFKYCNAHWDYASGKWNTDGASNTHELHAKLTKTVMLRRTKEEVLPELPKKQFSTVPILLSDSDWDEYNKALNDFIGWLREKDPKKVVSAQRAEAFTKLGYMKRLAAELKMPQVITWIREFLESDQKLVVFGIHKKIIQSLMHEFPKVAVRVDGSTPSSKRERAKYLFQNDPKTRLLIGHPKPAGEGIDLTAASSVCFVEMGWTPSLHDQAADRVHRMGQKADSVMIYYLLADNTVETKVAGINDQKRKVLGEIMDGKEDHSEGMLLQLLNQYKEEMNVS